MSPEGAAYAIDLYLDALKEQAEVAERFFYKKMPEARAGFEKLPSDIRLRVEQLLWEATHGEGVDFTKESQGPLIATAILHSVQERMGMMD